MSGRGDGTDEDEAWRSIVEHYGERARLDDLPDEGDATAQTNPADPADAPPRADETRPASPPAPDVRPDPLDPWVERHLAEEHYEPPAPPAVALPEPRRLLAWLGVLGVPVLLLLLVVLPVGIPVWGGLLMLVWFLGGFGYLVSTMRREDDDWDDGAVV